MLEKIDIAPKTIHIWHADLTIPNNTSNELFKILSEDEKARANRYRFDIHRQRFIVARGYLRIILSNYLNTPPDHILFSYSNYEKPFIDFPKSSLQFNISHSENKAVYAFALNNELGVDIEQIKPSYNQNVANRFFSQSENDQLLRLHNSAQIRGFFRIWARKEAIIKAIGKGLNISLSTFSVSLSSNTETIRVGDYNPLHLTSLDLFPDYEVAVCTNQVANKLLIFKINDQISTMENSYSL